MISDELMKKYNLPTFSEWNEAVELGVYDNNKELCQVFLNCTDHIPNKIIEAQILGEEVDDYTEILEARKTARAEINRIELEQATE